MTTENYKGFILNVPDSISDPPWGNVENTLFKAAIDDIVLNNTHKSSDGSDHSFIDQSVINGASPVFTGTNITAVASITAADESVDVTCFPLFTTQPTGAIAPKTGSNLTFNSSTGLLSATSLAGANTNWDAAFSHVSSDGKAHSDVVLNNTHRVSNGSDHSHVALNTTHRGSDGKDHSDVGLNNSHRGSDGSDHGFIDQDVTVGADDVSFGSLGVGTNTPEELIEVWSDSAHPILSITAAHATNFDPQIQYRTDVSDTVKASSGVDSGDSDKYKIAMGDGGVGGSSNFVIDQNGMVSINGDPDTATSRFTIRDGGEDKVTNCKFQNFSTGSSLSSIISLDKSHDNTIGTKTETEIDDNLGSIIFRGINSSSNWSSGVIIKSVQEKASGANWVPAYLSITTNDGTNSSEKFRLTSNGDLGLGTTNPGMIASWDGSANTIINIYDNTNAARCVVQGNAGGAVLDMVDLGGDENDKWLTFAVDGGVGTFTTLADDGMSVISGNILVMDLGTGYIGLGAAPDEPVCFCNLDNSTYLKFEEVVNDSKDGGTIAATIRVKYKDQNAVESFGYVNITNEPA